MHGIQTPLDRAGSKSISIKFEPEHLWSEKTPQNLINALYLYRKIKKHPIDLPVELKLKIESVPGNFSRATLYAALRKKTSKISNILTLNLEATPETLGHVTVTTNGCKTLVADRYGLEILERGTWQVPLSERKIPDDILVLCAVSFSLADQHSLAVEIAQNFIPTSDFAFQPEIAALLAHSFASSQKYSEALKLCQKIVIRRDKAAQNALSIYERPIIDIVGHLTPEHERILEKYLLRKISLAEGERNSKAAALEHYNLAALLRHDRRYSSKAILHYRKAAVSERYVENKDYIFFEMAELLLRRNRPVIATKLARKSLQGIETTEKFALLGDCYFHSGKFHQSKKAFYQSFDGSDFPDAQWCLKATIIDFVMQKIGSRPLNRRPADARMLLTSVPDDVDAAQSLFNSVILADPCQPDGWLGLGVVSEGKQNYQEAAAAYATCALMSRGNPFLWGKAILSMFLCGKASSAIPLMMECACNVCGENFLLGLIDQVGELVFLSEETRNDLIASISNIAESLPVGLMPPMIRVFKGEKVFKIVDEAKGNARWKPTFPKIFEGGLIGKARISAAETLAELWPRKVKLNREAVQIFKKQQAQFRKKFGREPGVGDPVFFDPDFEVPTPYDPEKMQRLTLEVMAKAGVPGHLVHIYKRTGFILNKAGYERLSYAEKMEVEAALKEYDLLQEVPAKSPQKKRSRFSSKR